MSPWKSDLIKYLLWSRVRENLSLYWWSWTSSVILYLQFHWNSHVSLLSSCVSEEARHPGWNPCLPLRCREVRSVGMYLYTLPPWFLTSENDLKLLKIIDLVFCFKLKVNDNPGKPTLSLFRIPSFSANFPSMPSLPLSMKIQTSLQHGAGGVAAARLCRHMSLFRKEIEEAPFNPRAAYLKWNSAQMPPACLPWTWKNRNGWNWKWLGKNEAPFVGDTQTQSSWMLFVPTPLFGICCWPVVICILLCWATSEIFSFQRQMMSSKPALNRPTADHLFL